MLLFGTIHYVLTRKGKVTKYSTFAIPDHFLVMVAFGSKENGDQQSE